MAFDVFCKITGLPGECTDDQHKDWIEVLNYSTGVMQPAGGSASTGGARSVERADHQDFSIIKALDKTSPKLFLKCCDGTHFDEVTIELCRATGSKTKYMEYKMSHVLVSSVRPAGTSGGAETLPLEEVTFNFGKIVYTYTETDHKTGAAKGNVQAHWDLVQNTGG